MAKKKRIPGWHAMRKEELVRALVRATVKLDRRDPPRRNGSRNNCAKNDGAKNDGAKNNGAKNNGAKNNGAKNNGAAEVLTPQEKARETKRRKLLEQMKARMAIARDLASEVVDGCKPPEKDRLIVMVRDSFWLHAYWELTRASVERAKVALGQYWHAAKPILRLHTVRNNTTTATARSQVRDIEIHGGVNNWYVDVQDPPKSYQMEIGYLVMEDRFVSLARSNIVQTTEATRLAKGTDGNWLGIEEDYDRIFALSGGYEDNADSNLKDVFEERLRRPMGHPHATKFGLGASSIGVDRRNLSFEVDAELVVFGVTDPSARVSLKGEPIQIRDDGTFTVRFGLPNRRQVLPLVASSSDGVEQRTIILAVERNTKVLEPLIRDLEE